MCVETMIEVKLYKTPKELKKPLPSLQFKFNQELYITAISWFASLQFLVYWRKYRCQKDNSAATSKKLPSPHFSLGVSALEGESRSLGSPSIDSNRFASKWVQRVCEGWAWGSEGQGKEKNEDGEEGLRGEKHTIGRYSGSWEEAMKMTHILHVG